MDTGFAPGTLAVSAAGHDRGRIYVVTGTEEDRILCADGAKYTADRPKKKNSRHLKSLGSEYREVLREHGEEPLKKDFADENIRRAVKLWLKEKGPEEA